MGDKSEMSNDAQVQTSGMPIMPGFARRILPLLIVYWIIMAGLTLLGYPITLVIGAWATITTIMLWPVGSPLGRPYTSYRTAYFIVGVASMVGIPLLGYLIITSTDPLTKFISLIALAVDIGIWGIPLSSKSAFSRPIPMLFRPDLLLGDGRLLAGGIVAMGLGMKFIFTSAPPGGIPRGNWYALFFVIILALIQIIPIRGMWKMRNRVSRLLLCRWTSYLVTVAKEFYLILAVVALMFSFHNFFGGVTPFTMNVLAGSNEGLAIMVLFAGLIIFGRSWYKKHCIGDPFIAESLRQSTVKHSIFAIGLIGFIYGFLNVMAGNFPRLPNVGSDLYLTATGSIMVAWGLILLIPVRAWGQINQRRAMMRQMVEIMLPRLNEPLRAKAMSVVINAAAELPEKRRLGIVRDMMSFLREMPEEDKVKVMQTQIEVLSSMPSDKKSVMMKAMDVAMA